MNRLGESRVAGPQGRPPEPCGTLISPANRCIELRLCSLTRVENGKVREERSYFDMFTMMSQLGLAPETK